MTPVEQENRRLRERIEQLEAELGYLREDARMFDAYPTLRLSPLRTRALNFLRAKSPAIVGRQRLFDAVWGGREVSETNTVDVAISKIRAEIGRVGASIETHSGIGWSLDAASAALLAGIAAPRVALMGSGQVFGEGRGRRKA